MMDVDCCCLSAQATLTLFYGFVI